MRWSGVWKHSTSNVIFTLFLTCHTLYSGVILQSALRCIFTKEFGQVSNTHFQLQNYIGLISNICLQLQLWLSQKHTHIHKCKNNRSIIHYAHICMIYSHIYVLWYGIHNVLVCVEIEGRCLRSGIWDLVVEVGGRCLRVARDGGSFRTMQRNF